MFHLFNRKVLSQVDIISLLRTIGVWSQIGTESIGLKHLFDGISILN
jgi:hypothetical protein